MAEFLMPSLGADMDTGTITQWLVHQGDAVHRGDIVAVVDTEKADVEVEIFEDGVVEELLVPEGTEVAVGTPLARIGAARVGPPESPPTPEPVDRRPSAPPAPPMEPGEPGEPGHVGEPLPTRWRADEPATPVSPAPSVGAAGSASSGVRAKPVSRAPSVGAAGRASSGVRAKPVSPVVRHLAGELGVDLTAITGTGRGGGITRADVERAASTPNVPTTPGPHPAPRGVARVSPRARRLAGERGIDLAGLAPTGPGGAVVGADVQRVGREEAAEPAPGRAQRAAQRDGRGAEKAAGMRAAIARAMARSKREIPHYYLATEVDFSRAQAFLQKRNEARPITERVLPAVALLKATALAARSVPELNGFWVDDELRESSAVHLGVAISLRGGGLVAPAIHDADERSLDDLMVALRDLVGRARAGSLRASEMSDPTITVTNLGDQGVQVAYGVIYPPQVALVGFGTIAERPWAVDGMVGAHPTVTVTLAADHRASDGARGARLLNVVDRLLQEPEAL
jgi:pyruvate dehydrogenase E2 component (dihydrolipoamide acetyltransferase)